ncbi:MAG: hypothetical protein ABJF50_24110 [Paracoccaceae bacterium]
MNDDQLEDVLGQIRWRIEAFADWYPFQLTNHGRVVEAPENLTDNQKLYVSLLVCGNLPFFEKAGRQLITDYFELVSGLVLKELWPASGLTITVGKNTTTLVGTKADRLNSLGKLIGANPHIQDTDFREGDQGDGGIDLAAYFTLDQFEHQNALSALAQCACSRTDWAPKHSEISHTKLRSLLPPSALWVEMLFTPISFRANSGGWAVPAEVPGVTLVDRLRLVLSLIRGGTNDAPPLPEIVDTLLGFRLDLV